MEKVYFVHVTEKKSWLSVNNKSKKTKHMKLMMHLCTTIVFFLISLFIFFNLALNFEFL